jgi:hypothetical protein
LCTFPTNINDEVKELNKLAYLLALSILTPVSVQAQSSEERSISHFLSEYVSKINKDVPRILDHETRLDGAFTAKNMLVYNYTLLNYISSQIDPNQLEPNIQKSVISTLCNETKYNVLKEIGTEIVFRYYGKEGHFITELSQKMANCDN